jgi:hypothetical protein
MNRRIEVIAQALADAHQRSWGAEPAPLGDLCDAGYWRKLASAALSAMQAIESMAAR